MDCVLINPIQKLPYVDYYHNGLKIDNRMVAPLDLAYCAAFLYQNDFSVEIIDANSLQIPNDKVLEKLDNPKIVVIATSPIDRWECPYLNIDSPVELAKLIKEKFPDAKVIFIGPHGTITPEWVFSKSPDIDVIIRGEPELTLLELVKRIKERRTFGNTFGISLRTGNNLDRKLIKNLDDLPSPSFNLLPMEEYRTKKGWAYMLASRGCLYKCTFCLRRMFGEDSYRYHSVKRVADEMEMLEKTYHFEKVYFLDLEFSINRKRVKEICDEIIKRNLKIQWACNVRWNDLDDEIIEIMKKANCIKVKPGVESCSDAILQNIQKGINREMILKGIELCRKLNMNFEGYGMICLPGETLETLKESIDFQAEHDLGFGGGMVIPYPGTALFEQAKLQTGNPNLSWEDVPRLTGRIGTNILNIYSIDSLYRKIRSMYFRKKFGNLYFFNSEFWKFVSNKMK